MFISNQVSRDETELEYQRLKAKHEDHLAYYTFDMMLPRLEPDGIGGLNIIETEEAKDYRNTLKRIAVVQTLLRDYRS
jgi:hypothetical protein